MDDCVFQAEKLAGVYDCDVCEAYPCLCGPDPDRLYELAVGK